MLTISFQHRPCDRTIAFYDCSFGDTFEKKTRDIRSNSKYLIVNRYVKNYITDTHKLVFRNIPAMNLYRGDLSS